MFPSGGGGSKVKTAGTPLEKRCRWRSYWRRIEGGAKTRRGTAYQKVPGR